MEHPTFVQIGAFVATLGLIGVAIGSISLTNGAFAKADTEHNRAAEVIDPHGAQQTHTKAHHLEQRIDHLMNRVAEEHPEIVAEVQRQRCEEGELVACEWVRTASKRP